MWVLGVCPRGVGPGGVGPRGIGPGGVGLKMFDNLILWSHVIEF